MDYLYPAFDNTSSLFPSPVQSPVPYGSRLDFRADWPAISDTNTPNKDQHVDSIYHGTYLWKKYVLISRYDWTPWRKSLLASV